MRHSVVVILVQCSYITIARKIIKYIDIKYTSLTPDKQLNSLIYTTQFCINKYGSYKLLKNSPILWPTLYIFTTRYTLYIIRYRIIHFVYCDFYLMREKLQ